MKCARSAAKQSTATYFKQNMSTGGGRRAANDTDTTGGENTRPDAMSVYTSQRSERGPAHCTARPAVQLGLQMARAMPTAFSAAACSSASIS